MTTWLLVLTVALAQDPAQQSPGTLGASTRLSLDGLKVQSVARGGPAEKAGLRVDDILLELDGAKLKWSRDLMRRLQGRRAGDVVKLTILRGEEKKTLCVTLGGRPRPGAGRMPPIPDGVKLIPDIAYREGKEAWKLDLAMPEERGDAPRPGLVFVHGGGWRGGDKRRGYFLPGALEYAQKGYVCITVNYRLVDEAPFPACVEDVKCAVRWFRAHAGEYNVDPDRIGGYGNSAGAHLVAMLGLAGPDAKLEGDGPYPKQSSLLNAVCASATPTDFLKWGREGGERFRSRGLLAGPQETFRERAKAASPITYVHADAPPFLLFHGTADTTVNVDQSVRFAEALREAGAKDVTYKEYDGEGHGVFGSRSRETHRLMEGFFDRTIGPGSKKTQADY